MPWHESIIEAELAKAKVLVNATSVGLDGDETPIPGELIPPDLLVMDLIYNPPTSRLLRDALAAGSQVMNGELMLLHQGAAAFTLWTGRAAPIELMHEKLAEGLAAVGATTGGAADEGAGTAGEPGA
jgi:shikimate dehydrogenase